MGLSSGDTRSLLDEHADKYAISSAWVDAVAPSGGAAEIPWRPLVVLSGGRRIEAQPLPAQQAIRLRFGDEKSPTKTVLELSVRGMDLFIGSEQVGSVNPAHPGLCTGAWESTCGLVASTDGLDVVHW